MSFAEFHSTIKENDTVIIYNRFDKIYAIEVKPHLINKHGAPVPNVFQTEAGALDVMSLVGRRYGCRVELPRGYVYVLYPTPELWTLTMPHRTQIIYSTDIAMIIGRLGVVPGSVVCEAGTGTGSLSHAFARAVGPRGRLHTRDFHEGRAKAAREEFERHGLGDRVDAGVADVLSAGWGVAGADCVFLDLPSPWAALSRAVDAVTTRGGRICSFSPCIEQVSRTCGEMRRLRLQNIRTVEVLTRELQLRHVTMQLVESNSTEPVSKKAKLNEEDEDTNDNDHSEESEEAAPNTWSRTLLTPVTRQPGHTGYLTFALVPPGLPRPAPPFPAHQAQPMIPAPVPLAVA